MTTSEQTRVDERQARAQYRQVQKMQAAARRAADRRWRARLAEAIADTKPAHKKCRCQLRASMTRDDVRALGAGCTAGAWVCPRLDAVRRRLGL